MKNNFNFFLLLSVLVFAFGCKNDGNKASADHEKDPPLVEGVAVQNAKVTEKSIGAEDWANCPSKPQCATLCASMVTKTYNVSFTLFNQRDTTITVKSVEVGAITSQGPIFVNECKGELGMNQAISAQALWNDTLALCFLQDTDLQNDSISIRMMIAGSASPAIYNLRICK